VKRTLLRITGRLTARAAGKINKVTINHKIEADNEPLVICAPPEHRILHCSHG